MVYNNPNVTSGITRETMKELYKLPHVKIVKDASMVIDENGRITLTLELKNQGF